MFRCDDGSFLTAHTKHGGCWKYAYPLLESQWIGKVDATTLGKATHLVKMVKAWKRQSNVDIKSIYLEVAAVYFVERWMFRDKTIYYYDWMIRDFFEFLLNYQFGGWAKPPGTGAEQILFGEDGRRNARAPINALLRRASMSVQTKAFWHALDGKDYSALSFRLISLVSLRPRVPDLGCPEPLQTA